MMDYGRGLTIDCESEAGEWKDARNKGEDISMVIFCLDSLLFPF
jgi:hypothetical protein